MTDDTTDGLGRRRLLSSAAVIGAAVSGVGAGAGTFAFLRDTERSADNQVQAGTLDLRANETSSITQVISGDGNSNLPGTDLAKSLEVELSNAGSLAGDHVEVDFRVQADEDDNGVFSDGLTPGPESDSQPGGDGMAEYVRIEELSYESTDGTTTTFVLLAEAVGDSVTLADYTLGTGVYDVNGNGWIDLNDLVKLSDPSTNPRGTDPFDDLDAPVPGGATTKLTLKLSGIAMAAGDPYQGDIVTLDVDFTLQQDSSQDTTVTKTE